MQAVLVANENESGEISQNLEFPAIIGQGTHGLL